MSEEETMESCWLLRNHVVEALLEPYNIQCLLNLIESTALMAPLYDFVKIMRFTSTCCLPISFPSNFTY
jgi:hypothetical protein